MQRPKVPCVNCPDREIGCHGHCEKYLEYCRQKDVLIKAYIAKKKGENEADELLIKGKIRNMKKQKGNRK